MEERVIDLLESYDALVREQREQILVLRAERDEARRAWREVLEMRPGAEPASSPAARPPIPSPADLPPSRARAGRRQQFDPADLEHVRHLSCSDAGKVLGCSKYTISKYRQQVEGKQEPTMGSAIPFNLNGDCEVCGQPYRKDGPRQRVCRDCRRLDPRVSIEALKALHAKRQQPTEPEAVPATDEKEKGERGACVGPSPYFDERCPLKKTWPRVKGQERMRCPDCHLECKRRRVRARLVDKRAEDAELAGRIAVARPPRDEEYDYETVWNGGEGLTRVP